MYCIQCGNPLPQGAHFCQQCGAPVKRQNLEAQSLEPGTHQSDTPPTAAGPMAQQPLPESLPLHAGTPAPAGNTSSKAGAQRQQQSATASLQRRASAEVSPRAGARAPQRQLSLICIVVSAVLFLVAIVSFLSFMQPLLPEIQELRARGGSGLGVFNSRKNPGAMQTFMVHFFLLGGSLAGALAGALSLRNKYRVLFGLAPTVALGACLLMCVPGGMFMWGLAVPALLLAGLALVFYAVFAFMKRRCNLNTESRRKTLKWGGITGGLASILVASILVVFLTPFGGRLRAGIKISGDYTNEGEYRQAMELVRYHRDKKSAAMLSYIYVRFTVDSFYQQSSLSAWEDVLGMAELMEIVSALAAEDSALGGSRYREMVRMKLLFEETAATAEHIRGYAPQMERLAAALDEYSRLHSESATISEELEKIALWRGDIAEIRNYLQSVVMFSPDNDINDFKTRNDSACELWNITVAIEYDLDYLEEILNEKLPEIGPGASVQMGSLVTSHALNRSTGMAPIYAKSFNAEKGVDLLLHAYYTEKLRGFFA